MVDGRTVSACCFELNAEFSKLEGVHIMLTTTSHLWAVALLPKMRPRNWAHFVPLSFILKPPPVHTPCVEALSLSSLHPGATYKNYHLSSYGTSPYLAKIFNIQMIVYISNNLSELPSQGSCELITMTISASRQDKERSWLHGHPGSVKFQLHRTLIILSTSTSRLALLCRFQGNKHIGAYYTSGYPTSRAEQ